MKVGISGISADELCPIPNVALGTAAHGFKMGAIISKGVGVESQL